MLIRIGGYKRWGGREKRGGDMRWILKLLMDKEDRRNQSENDIDKVWVHSK